MGTPPPHDSGTPHGPVTGQTTTTTTTTFSNYASLAALLLTTPSILAFYYMIFLPIPSVIAPISVDLPPQYISHFSLPLPFVFSLCIYLQSPINILLLPYFSLLTFGILVTFLGLSPSIIPFYLFI